MALPREASPSLSPLAALAMTFDLLELRPEMEGMLRGLMLTLLMPQSLAGLCTRGLDTTGRGAMALKPTLRVGRRTLLPVKAAVESDMAALPNSPKRGIRGAN